MGTLYFFSLVPVLAVALLLFFTAALRTRNRRGLALFCLSVAVWCGTLLLGAFPATAPIGLRMVADGAFVAAAFLHVAYDATGQTSYRLVRLAYTVALSITLFAASFPGVVYDPRTLGHGPMFWPVMALAVFGNSLPLWHLSRAYRSGDPARRRSIRRLGLAGILCSVGAMGNAALLAHGIALPFGMLMVLASLLLLASVVREQESAREQRLLDRSLVYAALTALLSSGFMFGVLSLLSGSGERFLNQYRVGAFFLLALALLAFEPLKQQLAEFLGLRLMKDGARSSDLLRLLEAEEDKAEHAERLAEIGTLVAAVAHEVRNPLGVLSANLRLLERQGAAAETVQEMQQQIERASRFVEDLLRYGRPRPLELRSFSLKDALALAYSTARQGLGALAPEARFEEPTLELSIEADQAQLIQALVVLFENALLALGEISGDKLIRVSLHQPSQERVSIRVEDSGPGVPLEIVERLFQPFISSRKRGAPRPGTGLGLATARRIVERHQGTIIATRSALGGASFELSLPLHPSLARPSAAEEAS